jgi:hypothetical protein
VYFEHVCNVRQDVHVVAEETDVVDAVVADGAATDAAAGTRL